MKLFPCLLVLGLGVAAVASCSRVDAHADSQIGGAPGSGGAGGRGGTGTGGSDKCMPYCRNGVLRSCTLEWSCAWGCNAEGLNCAAAPQGGASGATSEGGAAGLGGATQGGGTAGADAAGSGGVSGNAGAGGG